MCNQKFRTFRFKAARNPKWAGLTDADLQKRATWIQKQIGGLSRELAEIRYELTLR